MKILVMAATEAEIKPFADHLASSENNCVSVLYSGVGMLATSYSLTRQLAQCRYDFVLQAGVGGSFDRSLQPGQVVFVHTDRYGDLGAEDHDQYLDIFEMGLVSRDTPPFSHGELPAPASPIHEKLMLTSVSGLTVNTVSGNENTIRLRETLYHCQVESMEGAACHFVCLSEGVPFAQVRAISNYVTPRDKSTWKMREAIANLNNWLIAFIDSVCSA